jgi:carbonic anhydrase
MCKTTVKCIPALLLCWLACSPCYAAKWVTLSDNSRFKLMLDKQSVTQEDTLKKAWVKLDYSHPQNNPETLGAQFNTAKSLWYFNCSAQKSATTQVFQYADSELIYSARVEVKDAEFIEPVPESEVDIAMRHVCQSSQPPAVQTKPNAASYGAKPETTPTPANAEKVPATKVEAPAESVKESAKALDTAPVKSTSKPTEKTKQDAKQAAKAVDWSYDVAEKSRASSTSKSSSTKSSSSKKAPSQHTGPENWGKLKPEFATCETGKNQSPIHIEESISAKLKPIRTIQKFAAKEIVNDGHTVQINFKQGNMMVLDSVPFQMKQVHFHAPSENQIKGKSFPLEAHFVHADSKGNIAYLSVMFEEGEANKGLTKLWAKMPATAGEAMPIKTRTLPSELMPANKSYYRFNGSLTTPPCSEGVRWIVMKSAMTASKAQIETFTQTIKQPNNRPIQALNGRLVIE